MYPAGELAVLWQLLLLLLCFIEILLFNANSVDSDQMPHFAAGLISL